jgi:hypothetical protein
MMNNRTSIILCEPQCWGFEHASSNAGLLATVSLAYPDARIVFMGEKEHMSCVREAVSEIEHIDGDRMEWQEIVIPARSLAGWSRLAREVGWCRRVLSVARAPEVGSLILCSITKPGLFILKILLHTLSPTAPVLAVLHGILTSIERRQPSRPWNLNPSLRQVLEVRHPKHLTYLVLGGSIYHFLAQAIPEMVPFFKFLDHPYFMAQVENPIDVTGPIRFGYFGRVTDSTKGFELFARLASEVRRSQARQKGEFMMVGFLQQRAGDTPAAYHAVKNLSFTPLPRHEYSKLAQMLTYAVGMADPVHYRLRANASFLDPLSYMKPGIYLRNPFIEHYFGRMGDIGYLCKSYDEVRDVVFSILEEFPQARYRQQCKNIRNGRGLFEPRAQARRLREIVTDGERRIGRG